MIKVQHKKRSIPWLMLLITALALVSAWWLYRQWPLLTYRLIRWQMEFHRELGSLLRASVDLQWQTIASLLLVAGVAVGAGGFLMQGLLIFFCVCMTGFLYPNVTALALAPFEKSAGSASALLGTIQYTIGASAGALVGMLHNDTALPMAASMALCGVVGWLAVALGGPAEDHAAIRVP